MLTVTSVVLSAGTIFNGSESGRIRMCIDHSFVLYALPTDGKAAGSGEINRL